MPNGTQNNVQENQNRADLLMGLHEIAVSDIRPTLARGSILATATVKVGDLLSIRNVKIKEDDYGYQVVMPRIKPYGSEEYKDAIYFADRELKEKFDQTVVSAYEAYITPVHEEDETQVNEEDVMSGIDEEDFSDDVEEALQTGQENMSMGM